MSKFYAFLVTMLLPLIGMAAEKVSRAYGVRVYSASTGSRQTLVSFSVDNPSDVTEEMDLSGYNIVAATCHDGVYYMLNSADGVTSDKFLKLDMNRKTISVIKVFDWKFDLAASIVFTDIAYDETGDVIYAAGYNMASGEIVDGEVSAPFGIFTIDPATGDATVVGEQEEHVAVSLMVDKEGSLLGIDDQGTLWDIAKWNGIFNYDLMNVGVTPAGVQSMAYDFGKEVFYWASYSADSEGEGVSNFIKMYRTPDWEYLSEEVGTVGDDEELIGLYIDSDPLPAGSPSVVSDLSVVAGDKGALKATLKWTNPGATISGAAMDRVDVKIYRDGQLVKTISSSAAGSNEQWTDESVAAGMHTYSVSAANSVGEGRPTYADELWIGVDVPAAPASVSAARRDESSYAITVNWTAPAGGLHGGWMNASELKYTVVRQPDAKTILENSSQLSVVDNNIQDIHGYYYEVTASTSAGAGGMSASKPVVSGKPHTIPYKPDFNNKDHANQWTVSDSDNDGYTWYTHTTGWAGTYDVFFRYNPENNLNPEKEADDWLMSPAITLQAGKMYVVKYDVRLLGSLFPANTTLAIGSKAVPAAFDRTLENIDGDINDIEWTTHAVPFTVEKSGDYHFAYHVRNAVPVQFYKFEVKEVPSVDLAAGALRGNTMLNVGTESSFEVEIHNYGFNDVSGYNVELTDGSGRVVASANISEAVKSQTSAIAIVKWTPTTEGEYTLTPRVVATGDAVSNNNSGESMTVSVLGEGTMVHVTDGTSGTGYAPFYSYYRHSAVQTIYTSEMMNTEEGGEIKAVIYYLYKFFGQTSNTMNLEVALANVSKDDYSDNVIVPESEFTTVYSHQLVVDPSQKTMSIIFDKPFKYTGGNLCVFMRHSSENTANVYFQAAYSSSDQALHTCVYRGDVPFDFTQQPNGFHRDLPNVSFLMSKNSTGVSDIASDADADIDIVYSREAKVLNLLGDYEVCRLYSLAGTLLGQYSGESEISTDALPAGFVIVEVVSDSGIAVKKIIL